MSSMLQWAVLACVAFFVLVLSKVLSKAVSKTVSKEVFEGGVRRGVDLFVVRRCAPFDDAVVVVFALLLLLHLYRLRDVAAAVLMAAVLGGGGYCCRPTLRFEGMCPYSFRHAR